MCDVSTLAIVKYMFQFGYFRFLRFPQELEAERRRYL